MASLGTALPAGVGPTAPLSRSREDPRSDCQPNTAPDTASGEGASGDARNNPAPPPTPHDNNSRLLARVCARAQNIQHTIYNVQHTIFACVLRGVVRTLAETGSGGPVRKRSNITIFARKRRNVTAFGCVRTGITSPVSPTALYVAEAPLAFG
eukprot:946678-Prorocentrum_minimum.AAC.1